MRFLKKTGVYSLLRGSYEGSLGQGPDSPDEIQDFTSQRPAKAGWSGPLLLILRDANFIDTAAGGTDHPRLRLKSKSRSRAQCSHCSAAVAYGLWHGSEKGARQIQSSTMYDTKTIWFLKYKSLTACCRPSWRQFILLRLRSSLDIVQVLEVNDSICKLFPSLSLNKFCDSLV